MTNTPVDLTNLREMTDGDTEMEAMLFEEFISSSQECITGMENGCTDGENEDYRGNAHALKGTSINLGAEKLSNLCKEAQELENSPAAEKNALLDSIKAEFADVKTYLEGLLS